jgi:hypothetical protein
MTDSRIVENGSTAIASALSPDSTGVAAPSSAAAATEHMPSPAEATTAGRSPRASRSTKALSRALRVDQADVTARRQASCVLEVLAGVRSPEEAASALSMALPSYYQLETRALRGLIEGCLPAPRGRQPELSRKLEECQRRVAELQREVQRHQALLRNAQRTAGLVAEVRAGVASKARAAKPAPKESAKSRRPRVRALRAVAALRDAPPPGATGSGASSSDAAG